MTPNGEATTTLVDLSNRGCRLHTNEPMSIDQALAITIPSVGEDLPPDTQPLVLRGRVRRIVKASDAGGQMIAMTFDPDLPNAARTRLTRLINRWASGTDSYAEPERTDVPAIPACRLPSLPDLTLDDETDPPVRVRSEVVIELESRSERRRGQRAHFESGVVAQSVTGPVVLIGRDLSPGGMRVEAVGDLHLGDRFRLALHGPEPTDPVIVRAEVVRDDGANGFALAFRNVDTETDRQIQKILACLPAVVSLDDSETDERGDLGGIGAILSELMPG
jgi:c-di-GMP-binding flagellar brake protein YcgR